MVWYVSGISYDYDRSDPDFEFLERIARSETPHEADFSALNGGDWAALCLVGAGAGVDMAFREGNIAAPEAAAIRAAFEKAPPMPHETEFTLAYVDGAGAVKLLRHPHGFAFARGGKAQCVGPQMPVLALPVGLAR